jgi:peroxiredoxin Q/BCP
LKVGEKVKDFSLPVTGGGTFRLKQAAGKKLVIYFYPKDMTSGCTLEAHNFQHALEKYQAANAVILGVSVDSVDSHKQFCKRDSLTFTLLSDTDKKVVDEYGSLANYGVIKIAKRNTFLIDPQGKIVKVWTGVDPSHHSEEVLAALDGFEKR